MSVKGGGGAALPTFASLREPTAEELALLEGVQHHSAANSFLKLSRVARDTAYALEDMPPVAPPDAGAGLNAYSDDLVVAAQTVHWDPDDGDTWTARVVVPGDMPGSTRSYLIDTMRFVASSTQGTNCFISQGSGNAICSTTGAVIIWSVGSRCGPAGTWEWSFDYTNAITGATTIYATTSHLFQPHVPTWTVGTFNQGNYPDPVAHHYANQCEIAGQAGTEVCSATAPISDHVTIQNEGCMMTAVVDVLGYHDVPVTPVTYNDAARTFTSAGSTFMLGYRQNGEVLWSFPAEIAQVNSVYSVAFQGSSHDVIDLNLDGNFDGVFEVRNAVDAAICNNGPQIIQTHLATATQAPHYVAALGRTLEEPTRWMVSDPDGGAIALWPDVAYGGRWFVAQLPTVQRDFGTLVISLHSPVEAMLTDSAGRRCGRTALGEKIEEIPRCSFGMGGYRAGTQDQKNIELMNPPSGAYRLDLIGTGTGTYDLLIDSVPANGPPVEGLSLRKVPITTGESQSMVIDYHREEGMPTTTSGGFDGGGQRPTDVNKFLTYLSPTQARTSLPAGTTATTVLIAYGPIRNGTFEATLEGANVSGLFHPSPNTVEAVRIPLHSGSNVLKLTARGWTASEHDAADTDRLVFLVP